MKTIDFFVEKNQELMQKILEIQEVAKEKDAKEAKKDLREVKRLTEEVQTNRKRIMYLETNPSERFINSEIERLDKKIAKIWSLYTPLDSEMYPKSLVTKHKKEYAASMGIPQLSEQLVELMYIVDFCGIG